jgi:hypothetical protein
MSFATPFFFREYLAEETIHRKPQVIKKILCDEGAPPLQAKKEDA